MTIEMYNKAAYKSKTAVRVTITKDTLNFNNRAAEEYLKPLVESLGFKDELIYYVKLGYDPETEEIWLFPMEEEQIDTMGVYYNKKRRESDYYDLRIAVRGFVKEFDLKDKLYSVLEPRITDNALALKFTDTKVQVRKSCIRLKDTPEDTPPEDPIPDTTSKIYNPLRPDYMCNECGESNAAWKYKESFKPEGHPLVCPKCESDDFVIVEED